MNMMHKMLDITLGEMLERIAANPDLPLVFSYEGADIRPGYHATEVEAGQFSALLDCGAQRPGRRYSSSSGILRKATEPMGFRLVGRAERLSDLAAIHRIAHRPVRAVALEEDEGFL